VKKQTTPETEVITASLVSEDSQRLKIMPLMFGRHFMRGEALVHDWLRKLSEDYDGSLWHYYTLSNGGCYMSPNVETTHLTVRTDGNGFGYSMSPDAAGIVACLYVLDQLIHEVGAKDDRDALVDQYYRLLSFVSHHAERETIFSAMD